MRILVVNDDGIYSPGIAALARSPVSSARCASSRRTSSSPQRGTRYPRPAPLRYRRTRLLEGIETYRVNGTPADCVAIGAYEWGDVDVVLSGINLGPNLGNATWHSGTLAAAKQATLLGLRGIALSAPVDDDEPDFATLEPWIRPRPRAAAATRRRPRLVNVNFPLEPRGMRWTGRPSMQYDGHIVTSRGPDGPPDLLAYVVPLERHAEGNRSLGGRAGIRARSRHSNSTSPTMNSSRVEPRTKRGPTWHTSNKPKLAPSLLPDHLDPNEPPGAKRRGSRAAPRE